MDNELERLLAQINKKKLVVKMGSDIETPDKISTGSLHLDMVTKGGWPLGRVVVLYGPYGTAKSTMALWTVADAQKQGRTCLWIDAEKSFDKDWAKVCGADAENLPVITTRSLESILEAAQPLAEKVDVIVIDSISAVQSDKYLDEDTGGIAIQAKATKELIAKLEHWNPEALIICISQLTMGFKGQYPVATHTGGNALKHAGTYILKLWYNNDDIIKDKAKSGDRVINTEVSAVDLHWKLEKARSEAVNAEGKFRFVPGYGNDIRLELFELAVLRGVIENSGKGRYSFREHKWHGKESVIVDLEEAALFKEIHNEVLTRPAGTGEERGTDSSDQALEQES